MHNDDDDDDDAQRKAMMMTMMMTMTSLWLPNKTVMAFVNLTQFSDEQSWEKKALSTKGFF